MSLLSRKPKTVLAHTYTHHMLMLLLTLPAPQVGWPARPLHKVRIALQNSYMVSSLVLRIRKAPEGGAEAEDTQYAKVRLPVMYTW
eukprot:1144490-Pelagomonas_calceolata.AAC.7